MKVIKPFYNILKVRNYWFAIYYNYYIHIYTIFKLTYNFYLLYKSKLFDIIEKQINNILMLANNNFAIIKKKFINITKFITKKQAYFLSQTPIKFNDI